MRPTLGNYFEVGVGSKLIFFLIISIFNISFMLKSPDKSHSKIIFAPVP